MAWLIVVHISVWGYEAWLYPKVGQVSAYRTKQSCINHIPAVRRGLQITNPVRVERIFCQQIRAR